MEWQKNMNEQSQHTQTSKNELLRDEITTILNPPLLNGERLSEEDIQCSILQLIIEDQEWWTNSGTTAFTSIRQLVESDPRTKLAIAISSLMLKVAEKFYESIQQNDIVSYLIWADMLAIGLPTSSKVKVWVAILNRLSQVEYNSVYERWWTKQGKVVISDLYLLANENPQSVLATALASFTQKAAMKVQTAVQGNNLNTLRFLLDLLTVSISLFHGTEVWTDLIEKLRSVPAKNVIDIVSDYPKAFEEVLRQLINMPGSQNAAMQFFAMLAENGYPKKLQLLEHMLLAIANEQASMEMLLQSACLEGAREVAYFLELHCQEILLIQRLPPTLLEYIQQYLRGFDPNYLNTDPTRELLQKLQQPGLHLPTDLQAYARGWQSIAEFIRHPTISKLWLTNVSVIPPLTPDQQTQLRAILVPHLVKLVSTEMDLCRVLDNLAPVLTGSSTESDLLLLEQMINRVVETYKQDNRLLQKLIPYIKAVLGETSHLPAEEKREYICRCLLVLLECIDMETLAMLNAHAAQWPPNIQFEDWKSYLIRQGLLPRVDVVAPTQRIVPVSPLPAEEGSQRIVAIVNGQYIYFEQLRKHYPIKALYLQYDADIKHRANQNHTHSRKQEWQTVTDTQQLQRIAIDDLVDDVLIQAAIVELLKQDNRLSWKFDPSKRLDSTFQSFKTFWEPIYVTCLRRYQLKEEDIRSALCLFIRRDLFDWHLQNQNKSLNDWLKEQKLGTRPKIIPFYNIPWPHHIE